jgi:hypothetical protein
LQQTFDGSFSALRRGSDFRNAVAFNAQLHHAALILGQHFHGILDQQLQDE